MSGWTLRLALPQDAVNMPAIEDAAAQLFDRIDYLPDLADTPSVPLEKLQRYIHTGHCLVTHVEGEMVGFLVNEPFQRELHIWEFDVHPDFQGRGIGAGMLRACMIDARNSGFSALTLTTFRSVPWNAPFYSRLGFVEVEDLEAHPRLRGLLDAEAAYLPREQRCAMINFLS